ncbi:MAG: DsbA family oxidoreductase [Novosphingobium sp.]
MTRRLTIDIWSDVMCPWCIIGYRQLQQGLAQLEGEIEAEIRWLPFELNPDMPEAGEDQAAHLARKYRRTPEQAAAGRAQMRAIAERAGYSFAYTGPEPEPEARLWNTFAAHRLLKWALVEYGPAAQTRLKLALFDAHFQQRRKVGETAVLLDIAEETGLDRTAAEAALTDDTLAGVVRAEERQALDMNVTGVPAMVIEGKFLIPGAQEPEVYANALRRVAARAA